MKQALFDWDLTSKINKIASRSHAWLDTLEEIAAAISISCQSDAVWLMTFSPLQQGACGIMRTPREGAPEAMVVLTDSAPPFSSHSLAADGLISQVLKTGQPQFGPQLTDGLYNLDQDLGDAFLSFFDITLQAIVPISLGETRSGLLLLGNCSNRPPLSEDHHTLLRYLGQHLALTLENASLVETAQHQARQLAVLNRLARTITSSLNLDEVLQRAMGGIDEILDVEAGAVLLLDEDTNRLYFKLLLRGAESIATDFQLKLGEGIAGWVYQNQQPALANDVSKDSRFSNRVDKETGFVTQSALCTPLVVNGSPIGVLEVVNKRSGGFTLDDLELLTSMTASVAVAVQNSILFQQAQNEVKHMEQINTLTADINANLSVSDTAAAIVAELNKLFVFNNAILGLLDENKTTIQHIIISKQGRLVSRLAPIPVGDSLFRHVLATSQGCTVFDFRQTTESVEQEQFHEHDIESVISVLLKTDNSEFGLFSLTSSPGGVFTAEHKEKLVQISPALSAALEKARRIDAMERRTNELEELNLLSERLLTNTEPEYILDTALKYIPRLLPAAVHGLVLVDDEAAIAGLRLPENATQLLIDQIGQEMIETLTNSLHNDQATNITEVRSTYDNAPVPAGWQPRSKLAWPILTLRGSLGVVYLAYAENAPISADRIRLFSMVVSRISGTLENSRLFMEVEQERARLASILSSTADGIMVVDQSGRIILDNPAANQILEHNASQRNKHLEEVTDLDALLSLFTRAKKSGSAAGEFTTFEEKTYYTILSPVTVKTSIGKATVIGWVAVMQDVTHFKELNDAKDSFVNAVSHDLRSPLSGISLASQLIQMTGDLNERQQDFLKTIQDHIEAMTKLIDGLLDVGKIEADIDMAMELNPVSPIVAETVEILRPQAEQKNLQLTVNLSNEDSLVECNVLRLQQVFTNLIGNAIKYTPEQGKINVILTLQDDYLLFQVIDTGPGIPQADQPHIFEKFYRVRGEHMTGIKGSGLGLAITKSIVEKHNGTIWVDSKFKGGGSTFSVLLPTVNGISEPLPAPESVTEKQ